VSGTIWRVMTENDREAAGRLLALLNHYCFPGPFSGSENRWQMERWERAGHDGFVLTYRPDGRHGSARGMAPETFARCAGNGLAHYVREVAEPQMIRKLLRTEYGITDESEARELCGEAGKRLAAGWELRLGIMADAFAAYLLQDRAVHLEGFIRFRLDWFRTQMREALQSVWNERLADRQYEAFVAWLRWVVRCQETRMPAVHVLHAGGHAFRLYDERMRPLLIAPENNDEARGTTDVRHGEACSAEAFGSEDDESRIVSSLLAFSPRRIYIYTREPDARVIRTLVGIFGDRAAVCPDRTPH
jgi:putative sporulation protein YtxC